MTSYYLGTPAHQSALAKLQAEHARGAYTLSAYRVLSTSVAPTVIAFAERSLAYVKDVVAANGFFGHPGETGEYNATCCIDLYDSLDDVLAR